MHCGVGKFNFRKSKIDQHCAESDFAQANSAQSQTQTNFWVSIYRESGVHMLNFRNNMKESKANFLFLVFFIFNMFFFIAIVPEDYGLH